MPSSGVVPSGHPLVGVGHACIASVSVVPACLPLSVPYFELPDCTLVVAVGHDEQPLPAMACADFRRAEYTRRNPVAHALKVAADRVEPEGQMAGDVLEENKSSSALPDDPCDVGPEVPRVIDSSTLASGRERLTRVARNDEIHDPAPLPTVECGEVTPDSRRSQECFLHARDQNCGRMSFPLHETDRASISACCEFNSEVKSPDPGT